MTAADGSPERGSDEPIARDAAAKRPNPAQSSKPDLTEMRLRTQRLVSGDRRVDDLYKLLMWLGDSKTVGDITADIRSFVGHPQRRDQGSLKRHYDLLRESVRFAVRPPDLITWEHIASKCRLNISLQDHATIKSELGMSKRQATEHFNNFTSKVEYSNWPNLTMTSPPTKGEDKVVRYFSNKFINREAYNGSDVASDLAESLIRASLLQKEDKIKFRGAEDLISAFALASMNGVHISCSDGGSAILQMRPDPTQGKECLMVFASSKLWDDLPPIDVPVFKTNLRYLDWCGGELIEARLEQEKRTIAMGTDQFTRGHDGEDPWDLPLELCSDFLIRPLRAVP